MTRIVRQWLILTALLPAPAVWGQETDSLFFRADPLLLSPADAWVGAPPAVIRRVAAESFMHTRVSFTSEFMRRFNGRGVAEREQTALPRPLRIRALFDAEDPRLARQQSGGKPPYAALVDAFIEAAGEGTAVRLLTNPDEHLYADVRAGVVWQQQEAELTLALKKTRTGTNWSWEIIGVDASFLRPGPEPPAADTRYRSAARNNDGDSLVFIAPNAHELNFMGLAKALRSGSRLEPFIHPAARHDPQLTAMVRSLDTGQLRLQTLLTTTLWLDTQWGWLLQLRFFSRETNNSGWLISDVCRTEAAVCLPPVLRRFIEDTTVTKP